MKNLNLLLSLLLMHGCFAFAEGGVSANYLRLEPTSLPTICRQGDLRVNASTGLLNLCNNSNTWTPLAQSPVTVANGGTGFSTYTLGDSLFGNVSNTLSILSGNTTSTKKFLTQTGTGTVSAAPAWATIAASDLPNPTASTLGGIESYVAASHQWLNAISTSGVPSSTQPAFSDISGAVDLTSQVTNTLPKGNGGTGQSTYTDGQLLIGNSSGNTLTKSTLSAGSNITITNGNGSISIAASSSALPAYNYTSQTTNYNAAIGDWIIASGASFTITLPTAVGQSGKSIVLQHNGTSLSQVYTLNTTSGQTINGPTGALGNGVVTLSVVAEKFILASDGANWQIVQHDANTGWIADTNCIQNYYTFTVSSASATIAATYVPAWVFTVTAANATVGATYTNNGVTFTVAATISGATTLVTSAGGAPTVSGTLTKTAGTGDATITFSAVAGQPITPTVTVALTIASQLSLVTQTGTISPLNASGRLVKTAGTGDAVITYSAVSGTYNKVATTGTQPIFYGGTLVTNTCYWKRRGADIIEWLNFSQGTAGAAQGTGDYIFPTPAGVLLDGNIMTPNDTSILPIATDFIELPGKTPFFYPGTANGRADGTAAYYQFFTGVPFSSTYFRVYGALDGATDPNYPFTVGQISAANIMAYNFQVILPVLGWLP